MYVWRSCLMFRKILKTSEFKLLRFYDPVYAITYLESKHFLNV